MERDLQTIYVTWKRVMIRLVRAKGRLMSTMVQPMLFLVTFGLGLRGVGGSLEFFLPAVIFMSSIMSSVMAGMSVMWDKEFGFLKEILVAPVNRVSAVIGQAAGAVTTVLIQAVWIGFLGVLFGARINFAGILPAMVLLVLSSMIAVGVGISFASVMDDFEGFQMVQSIIVMPMIFLSAAFVNPAGAPGPLAALIKFNPLSYGVDGIRYFLTSGNSFPIMLDVGVTTLFALAAILSAAWFFERIEA